MKDNLIIILCFHLLGLFLIDYYNFHGFGLEAGLATIAALMMMIIKDRE